MPRIPFTVSKGRPTPELPGLLLSQPQTLFCSRNAEVLPNMGMPEVSHISRWRLFQQVECLLPLTPMLNSLFLTCFNTLLNVMSKKLKFMDYKVFRFQQVQNIHCKVIEICLEMGRFWDFHQHCCFIFLCVWVHLNFSFSYTVSPNLTIIHINTFYHLPVLRSPVVKISL